MVIGIMGAMPAEVDLLCQKLSGVTQEEYAGGDLPRAARWPASRSVVCWRRHGQGHAAATVQVLCGRYGAEKIIFSGIAGNMSAAIGIGDVCVGKLVVYHDADTRCIVQSAPFLEEFPARPALCAVRAGRLRGLRRQGHWRAKSPPATALSATAPPRRPSPPPAPPTASRWRARPSRRSPARNGVPCVILRAMSDNADEEGYERLVVKDFSIDEYVATATRIVETMIESL